MHKSLVEICTLKGRHASIFARLPIEDDVERNRGASDGSTADQKFASESAVGRRWSGLLHIRPRIAKGMASGVEWTAARSRREQRRWL